LPRIWLAAGMSQATRP